MNLLNHTTIKLLLLLIAFSLIPINKVKSQDWAPPGATWYYSYNNFAFVGYVEIKYEGDSLIDSILCKVLEKTYYGTNLLGEIDTISLGYEFTYSDSNKVYYYRFGKFYILYDFNAQQGDYWEVAGWNNPVGECDSIGQVQVDSVGTMIINSDTLNYLWVSPKDTSDWTFGWIFPVKIVEKIGCLGYMFPEPNLCVVDVYQGGPLRCYEDSAFGNYETGISSSCDHIITSIEEKVNDDLNILLYPNPASSQSINLEYELNQSGEVKISIFDNFGKIVKEINNLPSGFGKHTVVIDISGLSPGLYLCRLKSGNGHVVAKFSIIK